MSEDINDVYGSDREVYGSDREDPVMVEGWELVETDHNPNPNTALPFAEAIYPIHQQVR
jgi:hypothetical protein